MEVIMKTKQRWQDWINLIAGVWLFISPWLFGFSHMGFSWDAFVMGAVVIIFSVWALSDKRQWEEWVNLIIGIWVFFSPWILGFSGMSAALWNMLIVGAVVVILSIWALSSASSSENVQATSKAT